MNFIKCEKREGSIAFVQYEASIDETKGLEGEELESAVMQLIDAQLVSDLLANGLEPVGYPEIKDICSLESVIRIECLIPVYPEVVLGQYKGITIEKMTSVNGYLREKTEEEIINELFSKIISDMEAEVPEAMINRRIDESIEDISAQLAEDEIPLETYLGHYGKTIEDMRNDLEAESKYQAQIEIAYRAIAEAEKFEVTDEELDVIYQQIAQSYYISVSDAKDEFDADTLKFDTLCNRVVAFVRENANLV